jgi:hypothetical protein
VDLKDLRRDNFWREAALRAQGDSVRAAWAQEPEQERKPLRRDPPPRPPEPAPLIPTDDELRLRLAEELDYARRLLDAMGDALCADPAMVIRHASALQSIDIVGQMLGHVATVVRCSDPDEAVERIGMAELKARLKRRSVL